ncbi:MAG: ABC transporter permease [Tissierellia bacterium]|nr:ABC transporter permease [Tissierellia bacterium]
MKNLYRKLSLNGISKNLNIYLPFGIAYGFLVMVFNILVNIVENKTLVQFSGMRYVSMLLGLGQSVMILFSIIFLLYADNYIMKKRRVEFGLYNVLGLEKKQISKVVVFEIIIVGIVSILSGIFLSNLLYKLIGDMYFKIIDFSGENTFIPDLNNSLKALVVFSVIGILIIVSRILDIYRTSSIDLFTKSKKMEGSFIPVSIKAILGLLSIGAGYYIALSLKNPTDALNLFLLAVVLVIIGTYWGFSAISAVILNFLKLNKNFYYKINNFVAISGLRQRIKQNSDGLASICIMSCAALVLLGSAVALYYTSNRMIDEMVPRDFSVKINYSENQEDSNIFEDIKKIIADNGGSMKDELDINYALTIGEVVDGQVKKFIDLNDRYNFDNLTMLFFIDINSLEGYSGELENNEAWYFSKDQSENFGITIGDTKINTVKKLDNYAFSNSINEMSIFNTIYYFVKDVEGLKSKYPEILDDYHYYAFDVENIESLNLYEQIIELPYQRTKIIERSIDKADFMGIYGSVFFVGIFLGIVFIIATALVIYYKQLSEGYEDRYRFKIYRNVGMTEKEVKKSIATQVKTIFFLPPITAGIHIAVAFNTVSYLLSIIGLYNVKYKIMAFAGVYVFYLLTYFAIYKLTSNSYYKIISE